MRLLLMGIASLVNAIHHDAGIPQPCFYSYIYCQPSVTHSSQAFCQWLTIGRA